MRYLFVLVPILLIGCSSTHITLPNGTRVHKQFMAGLCAPLAVSKMSGVSKKDKMTAFKLCANGILEPNEAYKYLTNNSSREMKLLEEELEITEEYQIVSPACC
jgi:hypothetical protein